MKIGQKHYNRIRILLVCCALALTGCGHKDEEEEHAHALNHMEDSSASRLSDEDMKWLDDFVKEEDTTEDEASFYSDSPNTAEPREYEEDEIEVDITEEQYVNLVNEIYVNANDYIGDMIRIEGMYLAENYDGHSYCYIYRHGPGCCVTDGEMCGFEFTYNGELPKDNDWVEVVGTLRQYMEGEFAYLTLDAVSVKVLDERGEEYVTEYMAE